MQIRIKKFYIGLGRGATCVDWQIGKLYGGIPYWRFLRVGCLPFVRWDANAFND